MNMPDFTPDCLSCAALCCLALPFDKGESFAHAKLAGDACKFLGEGHMCMVHSELEDRGYAGCVRFECTGAGQRVTQEVFQGASWRDDAKLIPPMVAAFRQMRAVQEALQLLNEVSKLPLDAGLKAEQTALIAALSPAKWTPETLKAYERGPIPDKMRGFLASLRDIAKQAR